MQVSIKVIYFTNTFLWGDKQNLKPRDSKNGSAVFCVEMVNIALIPRTQGENKIYLNLMYIIARTTVLKLELN